MTRYDVWRCVIDGLPETHATRAFAQRHGGLVFLNFFNEAQRGALRWDPSVPKVEVNRTEALDASRAAVREKEFLIARDLPLVNVFARHMAADAKILDEDEETGARRYRYIRTGEDHFSLAFTYAWMARLDGPTGTFRVSGQRRAIPRLARRFAGEARRLPFRY
jgi:hypothetical protein